jgi:hypothetical protein
LLKEKNILLVTIFTIAMAFLESAVVVYLRAMYGIENLLTDINLAPDKYTFIEIGREAATILMLVMISVIAGNTKSKKFGYFFLSFGIWDIFYYIWLYIFIQWPTSLLEWDVLFLIPLPWWGPVIAPVLISILLITKGFLLINEIEYKTTVLDWVVISLSVIILLYTFVEDSIIILLTGEGSITAVRPSSFNWLVFWIAFIAWIAASIKVFLPGLKRS